MKTLIAVVCLVVAAVVAYTYMSGGRPDLWPVRPRDEAQVVERLQRQLEQARARFEQAVRAAGASGEDLTAATATARSEVERIAAELQHRLDALAARAGKQGAEVQRSAREKAGRLENAIRAFRKELEKPASTGR